MTLPENFNATRSDPGPRRMIGQNRCTMGAPVDRLPFLLSRKNPNCMPDGICKVRSKVGHAVIVVGNKTSDQWGD